MSSEKLRDEEHIKIEVNQATVVQDVQTPADGPPDGGYGWVCVASAFCINGLTWGVVASYGIFLNYYLQNQVFPGANSIGFAFVGGSNFAAALVSAPLINASLRKFGTHPVMFFGCVVWLLGWITASYAKTMWQLVLSQGVCIGLGLGFCWQPSAGIVSQWFIKRRSLAQGITSSGSGGLGFIFALTITPMIEHVGLSWTLRIIGITSFFALLVATYLIRDRNKVIRPTVHPFDAKLLKNYEVWLVLMFSFFTLLGYIVLLYSLGNFGTTIGLTQYQGGIVITLLSVGTFIGRLFIGFGSDIFGRVTVACLLTALSGILSFAWWINITTYPSLLAFGLIVGMFFGVYWACIAPISAEVIELKDLPSLLSLVWLIDVLPTLCSQAVALKLRRSSGEKPYIYAQIYTGLCFLISALILLELRRVKWGLWSREINR